MLEPLRICNDRLVIEPVDRVFLKLRKTRTNPTTEAKGRSSTDRTERLAEMSVVIRLRDRQDRSASPKIHGNRDQK